MNNQEKRISDEFVKDILNDIREMGCFTPDMLRYIGLELGKIADRSEVKR